MHTCWGRGRDKHLQLPVMAEGLKGLRSSAANDLCPCLACYTRLGFVEHRVPHKSHEEALVMCLTCLVGSPKTGSILQASLDTGLWPLGHPSKGSPQIKLGTQAGILCLFIFAHASCSPTSVLPTPCHSLRISPQGPPFHLSLT